jgi:hypothetical protein
MRMSDRDRKQIQEMMADLGISEDEATRRWATFKKKYFADQERIYLFLRAHNRGVPALERDSNNQRRIAEHVRVLGVSELVASMLVIGDEVLAEGAKKILRKRKKKSSPEDFQEMLGVSVPIPKEILDALGIDDSGLV